MAIAAEYQHTHGARAAIHDACFRDKTPEEMEADREITRRIIRRIVSEAELGNLDEG